MKLKRYAIVFKSDKDHIKTMWFKLTGVSDNKPQGTSWTLVDKFEHNCILHEDQADAFLNHPGTDSRYEKRVITLTISK